MVHALLVLASESGRSEVPFFVLGGLFAAWAVVIGGLGTASASFPGGRAVGIVVSAVSLLLAAACMALSVYVLS